MIIQDDRTAEQKQTHPWLVVATDKFMSGWGAARGGVSIAAWGCREADLKDVQSWVESRPEMKRVRVVHGEYRPKGVGHCQIYVADESHPALQRVYAFRRECPAMSGQLYRNDTASG